MGTEDWVIFGGDFFVIILDMGVLSVQENSIRSFWVRGGVVCCSESCRGLPDVLNRKGKLLNLGYRNSCNLSGYNLPCFEAHNDDLQQLSDNKHNMGS